MEWKKYNFKGIVLIKQFKELLHQRSIDLEVFKKELQINLKKLKLLPLFKLIYTYKKHSLYHVDDMVENQGPPKNIIENGPERFVKVLKDHTSIASPDHIKTTILNLLSNFEYMQELNFNNYVSSSKKNKINFKIEW